MAGETQRRNLKERERRAENAIVQGIRQLQESLEEWDITDGEIADKRTKLAKEFEEQNEVWDSIQSTGRREDEEWRPQEEKINQIRRALRVGNLQASPIVKQFLQEKGLPEKLSDREVEGYLRADIVDKEVARSKQLRIHYQKVKTHQRELQQLKDETKQWMELVEKRTKVHRKTKEILEEVGGLEHEKLKTLQSQLKKLATMLEECKTIMEDCNRADKQRKNYISEREKELRKMLNSESFKEIGRESNELRSRIQQLEKEISEIDKFLTVGVSAAGGAAAGALLGTALLPGLGTVVGGFLGAMGGGGVGAVGTVVIIDMKKEKRRKLCRKLEDTQKQLEKCKKIEGSAQEEYFELRKLLGY